MSRKGVFLFAGVMMLISLASAISTDLAPQYAPGETIITRVSGNILEPLSAEQVSFLRGHVKVPFEYDVAKVGSDYFIWALAPLNVSQNYTLLIENLATTVNGQRVEVDFRQNFSVGGNASIPYSVKPGTVVSSKDFELTVFSYIDEDIIISLDFPVIGETVIRPRENTLKFSIADVRGPQFILLQVGMYRIPAYIIGNATTPFYRTVRIEPGSIYRTHSIRERKIFYPIAITNIGSINYTNVRMVYNQTRFSVDPAEWEYFLVGEDLVFNVTLKNITLGTINERIYIESQDKNLSAEIPFTITIDDVTNITNITNRTVQGYSCRELGGTQCTAAEICEGSVQATLDGSCCIGVCSTPQEGNKAWIGYVIGTLVILIALLIYWRYRRVHADKNPLERKILEAEERLP